jgi:putative oxidoreductase
MTDSSPRSRPPAPIDAALLILRVVTAAVFGAYGWAKWSGGLGRLSGLMMTAGIPFPDLAAPAVAGLEVGGAALVLLGLWTRVAAGLLAVEMTAAIGTVAWRAGFVGGSAFEVTLLGVATSLAVAGGGRLSLGRDRCSRL